MFKVCGEIISFTRRKCICGVCFSFSYSSVFIMFVPTVIIRFQSSQSSTIQWVINNESVFAWNPTRGERAIIADETAATVRYQNSLLGAERTLMSPFWPGCIHHQRRRYSPLMPQLPPGPDLFITAASKMNSWTPTTHTDIYHLAGGENMNETLVQAQNIFTHKLCHWY